MKKSAQLSQEQLKKSISAKQNKVKLKNVLANPCPVFWPLLSTNALSSFKSILKTIISKDSTGSSRTIVNRNFIIYGLTCVHRNLKAGKVDSLILSTSIQPKFVAQQIIQQALNRKKDLKVICIDNLEDTLREVGIASTAVGLINQSTTNAFTPLHNFISKEFQLFPIPDGFIQDEKLMSEVKAERNKPKSLLDPNFVPSSLYLHKNVYNRNRVFVPDIQSNAAAEDHQKIKSSGNIKIIKEESSHEDSSSSEEMDTVESDKNTGKKISAAVANSLTNLSISSKAIQKTKKKKDRKRAKKLQKMTPYLPLVINRIHPNPKKKKRAKKSKKISK
ncbi:uncharacterized protein LOC129794636 [Lutzomyia longipalpis]|uniref:uncharacterized protein LOC129794636 n=1 Tax=Lutzomyia longipalpis TaxID=7200 RepID=UPI002483553E|nr:uncharacterized protein LOC129794636 [Lutzomyia longipalpis]